MNEGVATLTTDGTIVYGNSQLATMLELPMEKLIGQRLSAFIISRIKKHIILFLIRV